MNKKGGNMKKLFIIITIAIIGVAFISCTKKEKEGNITLKAYFQGDPANPQSHGTVEAIKAFGQSYPNVSLEIEYGSGEAYHQKFQTMSASGVMPDIFTTYVGKRSQYITETGKVLDLRPYLTQEFKDSFVKSIWDDQGENGEIYTVAPSLAVTHTFYANTALLEELGLEFPKTYEDLLAQIDIIREAGYYPVSLGNKDQWPLNSWLLSVLVERLGGKVWFDKAMKGEASFTDEPFVKALEIIDEMSQKGVFSPGINQMSNPEADQEFYQKKSVYLIDAAWRVSGMVNTLSLEEQDNVYMGVFPAIMGEISPNSSTAVPSEGYGINAALDGTERADAAWKFIEFYTGSQGSSIRATYGEIPSYILDIGDLDIVPLQKQAMDFVSNTMYGYVIDAKMDPGGMVDLNRNLQSMLFGNITPMEIATEYETWVMANDTNRQ